jgi:hypothetical protein
LASPQTKRYQGIFCFCSFVHLDVAAVLTDQQRSKIAGIFDLLDSKQFATKWFLLRFLILSNDYVSLLSPIYGENGDDFGRRITQRKAEPQYGFTDEYVCSGIN